MGRRIAGRPGQVCGRLTLISYTAREPGSVGTARWLCQCVCGNQKIVSWCHLQSGNVQSCGCFQKEGVAHRSRTHGMFGTRIYKIWQGMLDRCKDDQLPGYGGRGIKVHRRWKKFENFLADMGEPPTDGHSIDRIDNDGHYEPGNCQWATAAQQQRNRRNNNYIEICGRRLTVSEWSKIGGLSASTITRRLKRGWPPDKAVHGSAYGPRLKFASIDDNGE